jgi:sorbitol-specific phosphotransferase system component IIC
MDALQILINVANQLESSGIRLVIALGVAFGFGGCVMTLLGQTRLARTGRSASLTKVVGAICLGGALISLQQMMNMTAHTLSFGDVSFDAIAYAPASLGEAGQGINAVLSLLRWVGAGFFLIGILRMRRSLVDGHTGLSAREDVGTGTVMAIVGILLLCNPEFLSALQNTFQLSW